MFVSLPQRCGQRRAGLTSDMALTHRRANMRAMYAWPRLLLSLLLVLNALAMPWLHSRCLAQDAPVAQSAAAHCHDETPAPQDSGTARCHCACCALPSTAPTLAALVLAPPPLPLPPTGRLLDWPISPALTPDLRPPIG